MLQIIYILRRLQSRLCIAECWIKVVKCGKWNLIHWKLVMLNETHKTFWKVSVFVQKIWSTNDTKLQQLKVRKLGFMTGELRLLKLIMFTVIFSRFFYVVELEFKVFKIQYLEIKHNSYDKIPVMVDYFWYL